MKKHVFGFALFSFIVGAAAIAYAVFDVPKKICVIEAVVDVPRNYAYDKPTSCWNMRRGAGESNAEPMVRQAVFNLKTREFSWELTEPLTDLPVALHLFVKDGKGTRFVNGFIAVDSFVWADALKSYENLYVIAERAPQSKLDKKNPPKFDASRAVAVSLDYGK